MFKARSVLMVVALLLGSGAPSVAGVTVDDLLRNAPEYDAQNVTVTGTIKALEQKVSHKGNPYDVFELCADSCVRVFIFGHPKIGDGQKVTVNGTFSVTKRVGPYTFHDEIEADDDSL